MEVRIFHRGSWISSRGSIFFGFYWKISSGGFIFIMTLWPTFCTTNPTHWNKKKTLSNNIMWSWLTILLHLSSKWPSIIRCVLAILDLCSQSLAVRDHYCLVLVLVYPLHNEKPAIWLYNRFKVCINANGKIIGGLLMFDYIYHAIYFIYLDVHITSYP